MGPFKAIAILLTAALLGACSTEEAAPGEPTEDEPPFERFRVLAVGDNYSGERIDLTVCHITPRVGTLALVKLKSAGAIRYVGDAQPPLTRDHACNPEDYGWPYDLGSVLELPVEIESTFVGPSLPENLVVHIYPGDIGVKTLAGEYRLMTVVMLDDGKYYALNDGYFVQPPQAPVAADASREVAVTSYDSAPGLTLTLSRLATESARIRQDDPSTCDGIARDHRLELYKDRFFGTDRLTNLCEGLSEE